MKAFQYATALSPATARELVGDDGAYFAGGNDLLALMKEYLVDPKTLVNIKSLPGMNKIESGSKHWTIGALVTVAEIEDHGGIAKTFPGVQQAAAEVGSRQIRNVATIGGNLAQHSRCWYFRHRDVLCLKKGGDMCYAHTATARTNIPQPVHWKYLYQPDLVESFDHFWRAGRHRGGVAQRQGNATMSIPELYAKAWDNPTSHNSCWSKAI